MSENAKTDFVIVIDCDGIITDIWTPVEDRLRRMTNSVIAQYATNTESVESLVAFANNFTFNNYIKNFAMSSLTPAQRKMVTSQWDTLMFEFPYPMYHSDTNVWVAASNFENCGRVPFQMWAEWLKILTNRGVRVVLHSHVYTKELAAARKRWFTREIKSIAPHVSLKLDVGKEKSPSQGTIVVEDNVDNLKNAKAQYKILRTCFHNQSCLIPGGDGYVEVQSGAFNTYSSFFTLQYYISLFLEGRSPMDMSKQLSSLFN